MSCSPFSSQSMAHGAGNRGELEFFLFFCSCVCDLGPVFFSFLIVHFILTMVCSYLLTPHITSHHCQSCSLPVRGYVTCGFGVLCVLFLFLFFWVLLWRDIDIGILAHDLRHMTWEIRTWKYGGESLLASHGPLVFFSFFLSIFKEKMLRISVTAVFSYLAERYTVCNAMCCLCLA
jgi:hypothetical protein